MRPVPECIEAGFLSDAQGLFMSAKSHFPHPHYERPPCPKCGATMMLSRADRENPDNGKRTFDCIPCGHNETVILRYH
jgi:predicted RNA-binding Zn-ribbon protein involved in translation (DUF1610 family)